MDGLSKKARLVVECEQERGRFLAAFRTHGRDNPVRSKQIEEATGLSGPDVRAIVRSLRLAGYPIGSDETGYYWCVTPEDLDSTRGHIQSRKRILEAVDNALAQTQARLRCHRPHQERML